MPEIYKSALEKAEADFQKNEIDRKELENVERDEETRNKLKDLGYTDDEIGEISGEDFDLAKRFFERFPKKEKEEESKPTEEEPKQEPESESEEKKEEGKE